VRPNKAILTGEYDHEGYSIFKCMKPECYYFLNQADIIAILNAKNYEYNIKRLQLKEL
jgi:hypothetical protein